jgi:methyl-CpG-binding domain protein 4
MSSTLTSDAYVPLQAQYGSAPWRVLVVCALLNLTSRDQVRPVLGELFDRWPHPEAMALAGPDFEEFLRPLGLAEQRARRLRRMSEEFMGLEVLSGWHVEQLHACGSYSGDAFRIFCQGDLACRPGDRVLKAYVEGLRARVG